MGMNRAAVQGVSLQTCIVHYNLAVHGHLNLLLLACCTVHLDTIRSSARVLPATRPLLPAAFDILC